jgi:hypothetical protein
MHWQNVLAWILAWWAWFALSGLIAPQVKRRGHARLPLAVLALVLIVGGITLLFSALGVMRDSRLGWGALESFLGILAAGLGRRDFWRHVRSVARPSH